MQTSDLFPASKGKRFPCKRKSRGFCFWYCCSQSLYPAENPDGQLAGPAWEGPGAGAELGTGRCWSEGLQPGHRLKAAWPAFSVWSDVPRGLWRSAEWGRPVCFPWGCAFESRRCAGPGCQEEHADVSELCVWVNKAAPRSGNLLKSFLGEAARTPSA